MPGHSGDISQPSVIGDADLPPEPEFIYPEGPRSAVLAKPSIYPLLMPASLIAKRLIQKIGGLATGLRFSADSEFVRRAVFAGGVINVSACCYHRRIHSRSLTRAPDSGHCSPARSALRIKLQARAVERRASAGWRAGGPVALRYGDVGPSDARARPTSAVGRRMTLSRTPVPAT